MKPHSVGSMYPVYKEVYNETKKKKELEPDEERKAKFRRIRKSIKRKK